MPQVKIKIGDKVNLKKSAKYKNLRREGIVVAHDKTFVYSVHQAPNRKNKLFQVQRFRSDLDVIPVSAEIFEENKKIALTFRYNKLSEVQTEIRDNLKAIRYAKKNINIELKKVTK